MQVKNPVIKLLVAVAALFPVVAAAQTSSINAFSPYTMYGIGEVNTPGTLQMRSMGGVGVAMRSTGVVNLLNPAAYCAVQPKTFLFNFGLEGQNYYNSQTINNADKSTVYNTFNFHDVAFQLPVAKGLGLGFSLTPYSSVGYRTKYYHEYDPTDPVFGEMGNVQYTYQGEGDVTEVKLGMGWEIFRGFSIGAAFQYYWGSIDRTFVMTPTAITGEGSPVSTTGLSEYAISSVKGQVGFQWSPIMNTRRILTIGAAYDFGGDLNPEVTNRIYSADIQYSTIKGDTTHMMLVLPPQNNGGFYYRTPKWAFGGDYTYQNWGSSNSRSEMTGTTGSGDNTYAYEVAYTNTSTIKAGVEFTPNRYDIRNFMKRMSYRAGFRYGSHNQTYNGDRLSQWAVTAGMGIPVKLWAVSAIDVGVEFGRRGYNIADRLGLVRQQYFKIAVGFTLFAGQENGEYWFMRPKYD